MDCEIDLRPGGLFRTVMRSPEGKEFPNFGCYLEVVPGTKLVWTNVLGPGYRPRVVGSDLECDNFSFTAMITLEERGNSTKYTALVIHGSEEACKKHEAMGFHDGWGKALEQLVAHAKVM